MQRLILASFVSLILLAALATLVANGATHNFDSAILLWINSHANPAFDSFFKIVTELGGVIVVTSITVALFIYFLVKRSYEKAVLVSVGVGGAAALGYILKAVFERARPDLWEWLIVETNFSFPSGHAIGSSALALCIVLLLWRSKWRGIASIGAVLYVLIVSFSRLYLGVHYPSDIIGGWLTSATWLFLVASILYVYQLDNPRKKKTV